MIIVRRFLFPLTGRQVSDKPIITIKEARKLLGTKTTLTDTEIEKLIYDLDYIAKFQLKMVPVL